jgi:hypothetical protein
VSAAAGATYVTIFFSNRIIDVPLGIVNNVYIFVGPYRYPDDFVVVDIPRDPFCPIIFSRHIYVIHDILLWHYN